MEPGIDDGMLANAASCWWMRPHEFAERASMGRFRAYRHLAYMGDRIADAVLRGNARIIFNLPPRHGKSWLISYWTPTWFLELFPHLNVLLCGYADDQAMEWGRKARNELATNPMLRTRLAEDSKSARRFNTPEGGGMLCAGAGGAITGRGGHLNIIDDPIKNLEEAFSPTFRDKQIEWFHSDFMSRLEPNGSVIINMHRWHPEDLCGHVVEQSGEQWEIYRFPAIAEANDVLGRQPGEALCPERFNVDQLARKRIEVGESVWHPRYQQNASGLKRKRVYAEFSDSMIVPKLEWLPDVPLALTFDFNINPGMHGYIAQYCSLRDLFLVHDEIHETRMNVRECVAEVVKRLDAGLAKQPRKYVEIHIYGDATGESQQSITRSESSFSLIRAGLRMRPWTIRMKIKRRNPPVVDRINATTDAMLDSRGQTHFMVHPRCVRLIRDYREVKPDEDKGGTDKSNSDLTHSSEAVGYMIDYCRPAGGRLMIPRGRVSRAR